MDSTKNRNCPSAPDSPALIDITKLSPVTDLALNLRGLSTSVAGTPIRRISWSNPVPGGGQIGLNLDDLSPSVTDSPTYFEVLGNKRIPKCKGSSYSQRALLSCSEEKENVNPRLRSQSDVSVSEMENITERCSQDSGYISSSSSNKWRGKTFLFSSFDDEGEDSGDSLFHLDNSLESSEHFPLPTNMSSLLRKPLSNHKTQGVTPEGKKVKHLMRRCLSVEMDSYAEQSTREYESTSKDETYSSSNFVIEDSNIDRDLNGKSAFKRPEPPNDLDSYECKRRKSSPCVEYDEQSFKVNFKFKRSYSETAATIMHAILKSDLQPELVGDGSRSYALPLIKGRHQDLKSITPETLARLLQGDFKDEVGPYMLVDCRYPYEYHGGHIQGAQNIYTKDDILDKFFGKSPESTSSSILIFHCEFSSERAPSLCRFLRKKDREVNQGNYPRLHHPEIYILEGGYKAFYEDHKELCEPQDYKPMNHKDHGIELRHFRAKSKSWGADCKSRALLRSNSKPDVI